MPVHGEWRKCADIMPPAHKEVLAVDRNGSYSITKWDGQVFEGRPVWLSPGYYHVTYWMLPVLPPYDFADERNAATPLSVLTP